MPHYERGARRSLKTRHFTLIALYGAILILLVVFKFVFDKEEPIPETFGSLEGRFTSDVSLEYGGKTLFYRENEITNYLLIGMDQTEIISSGYQNGGQADFLLVLSIDRRNHTVTPLMIDRDVMTPVTTYGVFGNAAGSRVMQICLAQAYSGTNVSGSMNTARAVTELLCGVKIDRCLVMDLGGIRLLNDAVGGVTVTVEDDLSVLDEALSKGATVHLTGNLAEHFVRGRMSVADGTNASRMRRQKVYLNALMDTMSAQMKTNDSFAGDVLGALSGHIQTDTPTETLLSEVSIYKDYTWQPLQALPGTHVTGEDGFAEFHADAEGVKQWVARTYFN